MRSLRIVKAFDIFKEWVDVLIQCQDDRTINDTLLSVVAKLTDVRVVNNELKIMLQNARNEYWTMVLLVVGNIPLLYFLNKDWDNTLMFTTPGKMVLGIDCGCGHPHSACRLACLRLDDMEEFYSE